MTFQNSHAEFDNAFAENPRSSHILYFLVPDYYASLEKAMRAATLTTEKVGQHNFNDFRNLLHRTVLKIAAAERATGVTYADDQLLGAFEKTVAQLAAETVVIQKGRGLYS